VTAAEQKHDKYLIDIEGTDFPWPEPEITVPQLRTLAGWEPQQQVVEVDLKTMTETTLAENAIIEIKPGKGFAKKIRFQRG
jgi:hypothetical protein